MTAAVPVPTGAAIVRLESHADGLTLREAAARLLRNGPNEIAHEKPVPWWLHLWHCYSNPFNLLLTVLAVVSYLSADAKATIVIATMVALSTLVRFVQEGRSHRAADALRAMVSNTATVLRRDPAAQPGAVHAVSRHAEIPLRRVAPGDIVVLSAGDMIPADCRVLTARDLFVAQAAMTGESLPVEKFVDRRGDIEAPLEQTNLVFMGTNVVSGAATALVAATGSRTYFGTLAAKITATDAAPNAFQAGVNSVRWLLIRFALVMVPIVFVVNGLTKGNWTEAFLLVLAEGDAVGADARLVRAASLRLLEASLTGESEAVLKHVRPLPAPVALGDRLNMVYQGTAVAQGSGRAIVTATGMRSEVGAIAGMLDATTEALLTIDLFLPGGLIEGRYDLVRARTAGFTVLVLAQLFNCLNARSETASAFRGLFANRWLWGAIALSALLQMAVVHVGFLNLAFGTVPMSGEQWLTCVAMASAVLWFSELRKLMNRARGAWPGAQTRSAA